MCGVNLFSIFSFVTTPLRRLFFPPEPLTRQHRHLLRALLVVSAAVGYQGSIVTQAISFAADQFGSNETQQGRALAFIRADIIFTMLLVALADRVGRRRMLLVCAIVSPFLTACTSLATSLPMFAGIQIIARSTVTATAILLSVMGVEQLAAANRGWASSVLVGAAAMGTALLFIPVRFADSSPGFWRVMFLPPLVGVLAVLVAKKYITESRRFTDLEDRRRRGVANARVSAHWKRLVVIFAALFLMGIFTTPARQFMNDFLRKERGFTSAQLSNFGVLTNLPGTLGVLFGGAISDRKGRRFTIGIGLLGYGLASSMMFRSTGSMLWGAAMVGSLFGAFALPALSIFVAELFPTSMRSLASGISVGSNRVGSFTGLLLTGYLSDRFKIGPTLSIMAISIVCGALVVLFALPEPAGKELEQLNPEDSDPKQDERPTAGSFGLLG